MGIELPCRQAIGGVTAIGMGGTGSSLKESCQDRRALYHTDEDSGSLSASVPGRRGSYASATHEGTDGCLKRCLMVG